MGAALECACQCGEIAIVKWLLTKSRWAKELKPHKYVRDLFGAAAPLLLLLRISFPASILQIMNAALVNACQNGAVKVAKYLVDTVGVDPLVEVAPHSLTLSICLDRS